MKQNMNIDVSIVIICMNKPENLRVCLGSIKKYTRISYEVFVVAYLFSEDKLNTIRQEFPWVHFIESNEIRGFSENNNLALRMAKGKYCFVLNDDTEMKMPVVDMLFNTIENMPEKVVVISPKTLYPDGTVQFCGRPKSTVWTYVLGKFKLYNEKKDKRWSNQKGLFKSYNIIGAAFMIKTDVFRIIGWFDEYYFFSPEDKAVSTKLNNMGYECWVDENVGIVHYEGMTGLNKSKPSKMQMATKPAQSKGTVYFYAGEKKGTILYWLLCLLEFLSCSVLYAYYRLLSIIHKENNAYPIILGCVKNICESIFTNKTPKEIFLNYYRKIE